MKNKLFFLGMLLAAFAMTSCNKYRLNPNDPNPHCFLVSYQVETGETFKEYWWVTDAELYDEILTGIAEDGYTPLFERINEDSESDCYALEEEEEEYREITAELEGNIVFVTEDNISLSLIAATTLKEDVSVVLHIKGINPLNSFTEKDFLNLDEESNVVSPDGGETLYKIEKASFSGKEITNDPVFSYEFTGWFECTNHIRYNLTIRCMIIR